MKNKRLFGRVCYLQRQMQRENTALFSEYGINPGQMNVLVFVQVQTDNGRRVCQRDIEKYINLRASSVSILLSSLEKSGFIVRTVAEGDARTKYITLTEKGKSICIKNKLLMDRCDALIESALTEEEQRTFLDLLNKILAEIERHEKEVKN